MLVDARQFPLPPTPHRPRPAGDVEERVAYWAGSDAVRRRRAEARELIRARAADAAALNDFSTAPIERPKRTADPFPA
jgi:hypothetical protein